MRNSQIAGCLSAGTNEGKLATWKRYRKESGSVTEQWKLQEAMNVGSKVNQIKNMHVLSYENISRKYWHQYWQLRILLLLDILTDLLFKTKFLTAACHKEFLNMAHTPLRYTVLSTGSECNKRKNFFEKKNSKKHFVLF